MKETSDLYLAAFLKTKGVSLMRCERVNGRVVFQFENANDDWDYFQRDYWQTGEENVNAARYGAELRQLKVLLHSDGLLRSQGTGTPKM